MVASSSISRAAVGHIGSFVMDGYIILMEQAYDDIVVPGQVWDVDNHMDMME